MIDIQDMIRGKGALNLFDGQGWRHHEWAADGLGQCVRCGVTPEAIEDGYASPNCHRQPKKVPLNEQTLQKAIEEVGRMVEVVDIDIVAGNCGHIGGEI